MLDAPDEFHQTIMSRGVGGGAVEDGDDDEMLQAAKKLAGALRAKRAYTNTATFELKCQVGVGICGSYGAVDVPGCDRSAARA